MPGPAYVVLVMKVAEKDAKFLTQTLISKNLGTSQRREKHRIVNGIKNLLTGLVGGALRGDLWLSAHANDSVYPAGQIVCTQANAAADTVTFTYAGTAIVFTEGSSDPLLGFARGASNTTCGDALAAKINAHPVIGGIMAAVNTTGTVALTSKVPGQSIRDVVLSTSDGTAFALTQFAAGTRGASELFFQAIQMGKTP